MTKRLEDEINKMRYKNQPMRLNLITCILILMCSFLLVIATFLQVSFDYSWFLGLHAGSRVYYYVPQVPVLIFIATLLGTKMGLMAVLFYILCGMFMPVFALGGGLDYILKTGFGYILAFIPAVIFAGNILKKKFTLGSIIKASFCGTLVIHVFGLIYAMLIMIVSHSAFGNLSDFILMQSSVKFVFDFLICILAAYCGQFMKHLLWIIIGE